MAFLMNDSEVIARESQEKAANLLHRLQEMNKLYRESQPVPDFNATLPAKISAGNPIIVNSEYENRVAANQYVNEQKRAGITDIENKAGKKLDVLDEKAVDAYNEKKNAETEAVSEYQENRKTLQRLIAASGADDSTYARNKAKEYYSEYTIALMEIGKKYTEYKNTLTLARETVESEKKIALREYDLKLADMYEKKLLQLQKESDRAAEQLAKYNKKIAEEFEIYTKENQKLTAEAENKWLEDFEDAQNSDYWASVSAGKYVGESADEMNARYNWALKKYKEMDAEYAVKHMTDKETELRRLLGSGYDRLLSQIGG